MRNNNRLATILVNRSRSARGALLILAALGMTAVGGSAWAEIYRFVDSNGVVNYSNFRPNRGSFTVVRMKCKQCGWQRTDVNWSNVPLYLDAYTREILDACERHGVDEALVRAIIHAESSFRHRAVSDMGAQGLMQLMPATAERFGVRRPFDPGQNIEGGVKYLRTLSRMFNYDTQRIAAAYNAGEGAVKRYGGIPPYSETRTFVNRVETLRKRYARALKIS